MPTNHQELDNTGVAKAIERARAPTHDVVTDHIVRALIENFPRPQPLRVEIIKQTGDHPGTTYHQLRVLGTNSPECPHRLRGWVQSFGQGRYGLTPAARRRLQGAA